MISMELQRVEKGWRSSLTIMDYQVLFGLPIEYCSMSRASCCFSGKIPREIGNLTNLWKLKLNKCSFTGKNTFLALDNCVHT